MSKSDPCDRARNPLINTHMNVIDYPAHGFKDDFGTTVRTTDLHVTLVVRGSLRPCYDLYVFHGHPGGAFWRNSGPLVSCDSMDKALEKGEQLYGIVGSRQFIRIIHE